MSQLSVLHKTPFDGQTITAYDAEVLITAARRGFSYQNRADTTDVAFLIWPYNREDRVSVWCGDIGTTESVGVFLNVLFAEASVFSDFRDLVEVGFYRQEVEPKKYDYIAFARDRGNEYLLCGGMTDYSGEGGAGRKLMATVLNAVAHYNTISLCVYTFLPGTYAELEQRVRQAINSNLKP